ncbi:MAG: HD domain-containing protein [Burkholderiales bacterium]|nr:HD domain-containing protein [Burkholderiales bacterium]
MTALSRFHLLMRSVQPAGRTETDQVYAALLAEANEKLAAGNVANTEFFTQLIRELGEVDSEQFAEERCKCLLVACQFFYITGQPFSAIDPASDAVRLARLTADRGLLRRALNVLGILSADSGSIARAIECYAEALDLSRSLRDEDAECATWNNLGVALFYAAQYQDAMACNERALKMTEANSALKRHRPTALSNIALCSLHLEDFKRGLDAAEKSIAESPEPRNSSELLSRVLCENHYARLLLEVDSVDKARERCEIARSYATRSKSERAEIVTSIVEGLTEVQSGRIDVGLSRLSATLEKARLLRAMLRDALIAMVKAYEMIGQPEKALSYLRELMNHTRTVQQDNALRHNSIYLKRLERGLVDDPVGSRTFAKREAQLREQVTQKELIKKEAETELAIAEKDKARRDLFRSRIEMLERMAVTAELRDDSTGEHSYRVGKLASLLAHEFGCDEETCFMIDLAARLHDIGKIGVPDAVLLKPGKLNDAELQVMRAHPVIGAELLSKSDTPHVQMAEEIARNHHEWWNGTGYPASLSGAAIPISARITSLADVFDALTHKRPYKEAWPFEQAVAEIARQSGTQFDPQLAELFIALVTRLRSEHVDLDAYLGQAATTTPFMQARAKIQNALLRPTGEDTASGSRLDLQR